MERRPAVHGFGDVDGADDPAYFARYLDAAGALAPIQAIERRIVDRLAPRAGGRFLDVGCGTGDDARALAGLVGPTGLVIGVDSSETMIAEARRRSEGVALPVEFRLGDAARLDFPDAVFDGCRAERVLIHVADPRAAVGEMVRVARQGGRVVGVDSDCATLVVDAPDRATTRAILGYRCDGLPNGWIGRQLRGLFLQTGLADVTLELMPFFLTDFAAADRTHELRASAERAAAAGAVSPPAAAAWVRSLEDAAAAGLFLSAVTGFLVSGRKP